MVMKMKKNMKKKTGRPKKNKLRLPDIHNYSHTQMYTTLSGEGRKRKSISEYQKMKKKDLYRALVGFIANYDRITKSLVDLQLENNFLNRRIEQMKHEIKTLKSFRFNGKRGNHDEV